MRELDGLIDRFLDEHVQAQPVVATKLGIDGHDHRLAEHTTEAYESRRAWRSTWLDRFESLTELNDDEQIDRDLLTSTLRSRQLTDGWQIHRRNPAAYIEEGLQGVFGLFLYRPTPDEQLAQDAAARLAQVPDILESGKQNLDPALAAPVFVERALGSCRAAATYCRELVPAEVDESLRGPLTAAGEEAARAYESFGEFLKEFQGHARGDYAIGEDLYSAMLRSAEMLPYGVRELRDRGQAAYDELDEDLRRRARELGDTEEWVKVLGDLNADHPASPTEMRDVYADWTERARQFLIQRGLVTLPDGERCLVEASPPFQRPIMAVASYMAPPAFKPSLTGHFFVPWPPDGESPEGVTKRLEANNFSTIPTVSVHEAYPGHHWHLTMMTANPRKARKVFGSSYFSEGWALYSEKMMLEEGFYDDPRHEFGVAVARIFRAARIVVDTGLHIGDMDVETAVDFMMNKIGFPEPVARAEVGRYCTWPTQASSYLTGSLEIERMRDRWFAEGRGDLRAFHDRVTSSGSMPLPLAERAVFSSTR
jgi:uncharacterized protein (DUF885 family)